jgi:arginase
MIGPAVDTSRSKQDIVLIKAPCNLGLRPPAPDREPGTWQAPAVLQRAGLDVGLQPAEIVALKRPSYDFTPQPGTSLRNGLTLRRFNEALASAVAGALGNGWFPIVVGGDCGILLGALAGARRHGELALVHIDGHSDFRHPGNYDVSAGPAAAAGMDLALSTGRGEALLTDWDGRPSPLVPDRRVVQIGDREARMADYAWRDIFDTAITQLDIFWVREQGLAATLSRAFEVLDESPDLPYWVHLDVDVLDQAIMPAVDSPGSPGLDYAEVSELVRGFVASPRCLGCNVTIYDPDLDPDRVYAPRIVGMLLDGLDPVLTSR